MFNQLLARLLASFCYEQRQYRPNFLHIHSGSTNATDAQTDTQQWHYAFTLAVGVRQCGACMTDVRVNGLSVCLSVQVEASRSAQQKNASPSSTSRTSLWLRPGSARPDGMKQQSVGHKGERQERSGWKREYLAWKLLLCNKVSLCFSLLPPFLQQVKCEFLSCIVWWSELSALNPNES